MAFHRNQGLQIMRALALLAVLLRHALAQVPSAPFTDALERVVVCFHMPAFFILAGYFFQLGYEGYLRRGRVRFLIGKAKHLLLPYLFWFTLLWAGVQLAFLVPPLRGFLRASGFAPMGPGDLLRGLLLQDPVYTEHLWFLYVLFAYFLAHILLGRGGAAWYGSLAAAALGLGAALVKLPSLAERMLSWGVFFCAGRLLGDRPALVQALKRMRAPVPPLLFAVSAAALLWLNGRLPALPHRLLQWVVGLTGCLLLYRLSLALVRSPAARPLTALGDASYAVYLMHNPYFVALPCALLTRMGLSAAIVLPLGVALGAAGPLLLQRLAIGRFRWLRRIALGQWSDQPKENA